MESIIMDLSLLQDFIVETTEHLEEMEAGLLKLESMPDNREILNDIFRDAHTIKGSAEYLGMEKIGELSHKLENLLEIIRHGDHRLDKEIINTLIDSRDRIAQLVKDLEQYSAERTEIGDILERIDRLTKKASQTEEPHQLPPKSVKLKHPAMQSSESPKSVQHQETIHDIELQTISEEEYDQELFSIFIQHLKENLTLLYQQVQELPRLTDKHEALKKCFGYVNSLHSSANYMDYTQLNRLYDLWRRDIQSAQQAISEGKTVSFDFMNDYIQKIAKAFSKYQLIDITEKTPEKPVETQKEQEELIPLNISGFDDLTELGEFQEVEDIEKIDEEEEEEGISKADQQVLEVDTVEISDDVLLDEDMPTLEKEMIGQVLEPEVEDSAVEAYQGLFEELDSAFEPGEEVTNETTSKPSVDFIQELEEKFAEQPEISSEQEEVIEELKEVEKITIPEKEQAIDTLPKEEAIEQTEVIEPIAEDEVIQLTSEDEIQEAPEAPVKVDHAHEKVVKQSLRVDARKIDALMNQVGELVVSRAWFSQLFNEMKALQEYLHTTIKLDGKQMKPVKALTFRISEATVALGRVANELQESVMKVRMLPIAQLFNRYPRLIRDLTQGTNKKVELDIVGEDTELDKMVIEEISDPMIHILRNAVDHGCEPVEERIKLGKPEVCRVKLESYHESNHVVIEVSDDGRGINPELIKAVALKKKFYTKEELDRMTQRDILSIIMKPGFSTASQVSKTSGRGVGMDVVKQNVEKLNGTVEIDSKLGEGTRFRIKIPLTLAIIQALLVRVGKDIFTIPLAAVEETLRIMEDDITTIEGVEVIHLRDSTLSLLRLSDIFRIPSQPVAPRKYFVVVVNTGIHRAGFVVDALIGQEETVIKPLVDYLQENSGFSGATILGDGRISLILDIYELVNMAISRRHSRHAALAKYRPDIHYTSPMEHATV